MSLRAGDGVLLVAHGTVENLDDMPEFLARIRHGRPASPELVNEIKRRYQVVGGSPLLTITRAQASALGRRLEAPVLIGMRLWQPSVEDALRGAAALGLRRLCVLPLAPFSVHVYVSAAEQSLERVRSELGERAPRLIGVRPWGSEPRFIAAQRQLIERALGSERSPRTELVLSAHSLPTRAIQSGDPYQTQFEACAHAIAEGLGVSYRIAYQSQGADGGDWLGPDLRTVFEACQRAGTSRVILAPVGFLADHIETLYDLDVEAKAWANELGFEFVRLPALNQDAAFIDALGHVAEAAFASDEAQ